MQVVYLLCGDRGRKSKSTYLSIVGTTFIRTFGMRNIVEDNIGTLYTVKTCLMAI